MSPSPIYENAPETGGHRLEGNADPTHTNEKESR